MSVEFLQGLHPAQALHAWVGACPSLFAVRKELASIEGHFDDFHAVPDNSCLDLFTDGSCLKPQEPNLRLATWAVTYAPLEINAPSVLISAGPVPSMLQSPYRGELCAAVSALKFAWNFRKTIRIWTDCQALLNRLRKWQNGGWRPSQRSPHWDLWSEIIDIFDDICHHVSFHKVAAHVDLQDSTCFADEWCTLHNDAVDSAAKNAQALRCSSFWTLWHGLWSETSRAWSVGRQIMQLHVLIAKKSVLTKPTSPPCDPPYTCTDHCRNLTFGDSSGTFATSPCKALWEALHCSSATMGEHVGTRAAYTAVDFNTTALLVFLPYLGGTATGSAVRHVATGEYNSERAVH